MARTIKFALEMKDGVKVRRTLEEIREHFDLGKAMEYFASGKLAEWLEDRGYEEEAAGLRALDSNGTDFPRQLCEVLGVEYTGGQEVDMDAVSALNEKVVLLRQKTSDEEIIAKAAEVAFTQKDLAERLEAGAEVIYLCGDEFFIPRDATGKKFVGVGKTPKVMVEAVSLEELADRNLVFENMESPRLLSEFLLNIEENLQANEAISQCGQGFIIIGKAGERLLYKYGVGHRVKLGVRAKRWPWD